MRKRINRILTVGMSCLLLATSCFATTTGEPVLAAKFGKSKEEVVYIMTNAQGAVRNVNVVNIFDGGTITDYGNYSKVKMLTSNDKITQKGDKITFSTKDEKVYYQGTMDNAQIPWNINIRYYLNGVEFEPDEIAGKNGALKIYFQVNKNKKCKGTFYDDFALQAAFTLDTKLCENIQSDGATVANVGSKKQLTYTILPGKGIDTAITAQVKNFAMDAVAINGVRLNLNVDVDDKELLEKVDELMDATNRINEGAGSLSRGSGALLSGSDALNTGITKLNSGVTELDNGILTLQNGVVAMQDGLDRLNSNSDTLTGGSAKVKEALETIQASLKNVAVTSADLTKLTDSSSEIKSGILSLKLGAVDFKGKLSYANYKEIMLSNGLDIDRLQAGNQEAIDSLTDEIKSLKSTLAQIENVAGYEQQANQLQAQINSLQNVVQVVTGDKAALSGIESYLAGLSSAADTLSEGLGSLQSNYEAFDQAIGTMANALSGLAVKVTQLTDGINQLVENYSALDEGIGNYTEGVATIVASYKQIVNGVSSLAQGSNKLLQGSGTLSSGANELYDGVVRLCNGAGELAEGTNKLNTETSGMDSKVEDEIDKMLESIQGNQGEVVSFVSNKNKAVDALQFVIKTDAVEVQEVEQAEVDQAVKEGFWQKLVNLFHRK